MFDAPVGAGRAPTIAGNEILASSSGRTFGGSLIWSKALAPSEIDRLTTLAVDHGAVHLLAPAASNGTRLWSARVGAMVPVHPTAPAVAAATLVVDSEDELRAYRPR